MNLLNREGEPLVPSAGLDDAILPVRNRRTLGGEHYQAIFLICGVLFVLAETFVALERPLLGTSIEALLFLLLTIIGGTAPTRHQRRLALLSSLFPLIQLTVSALPLANVPDAASSIAKAALILFASVFALRRLRIPLKSAGLRRQHMGAQLLFGLSGVALGVCEYLLLPHVVPPTVRVSYQPLILALLVATGICAELMFRGVLPFLAQPVLRRTYIVFAALIYTGMQFPFETLPLSIFAFFVAVVYLLVTRWSGSLIGVALAHTITNIVLFVVLPSLGLASDPLAWPNVLLGAWVSAACGIVAALLLAVKQPARQTASAAPAQSAVASAAHDALPMAQARGTAQDPVAPIAASDEHHWGLSEEAESLIRLQFSIEGPVTIRALIDIPSAAQRDQLEPAVKVYVHDRLVLNDVRMLLPRHFSFIRGSISLSGPDAQTLVAGDSANGRWALIMRSLSSRLTRELDRLADENPETFRAFWREYGRYFGGPPLPDSRYHYSVDTTRS